VSAAALSNNAGSYVEASMGAYASVRGRTECRATRPRATRRTVATAAATAAGSRARPTAGPQGVPGKNTGVTPQGAPM